MTPDFSVMAVLLLIIVWVTAALCAVAAAGEIWTLWQWKKRAQPRTAPAPGWGLYEGTVHTGLGPDGTLATHTLTQVGRALDGVPRRIGFWDRSFKSEIFGGSIEMGGTQLTVPTIPATSAEVWAPSGSRESTTLGFEAAWTEAAKAKGWVQEHRHHARTGTRVFVIAQADNSGGAWRLSGTERAPLAVALFNPHSFFSNRIAWGLFFIVAELLTCGALTLVALAPPAFGTVSMLGAAALVGYFLGVTPIGVAYKKACRLPSVAFVRGEWNEQMPSPAGVGLQARTDAKSLN